MTTLGCAVAHTATLSGVHPIPVEVQVDVRSGLPSFQIVGLADAAVLEARERVRSAIHASGFEFPNARIVVNLAPAPVRKHGTGFDLPIAAGILAASGQVPAVSLRESHLVGELSLTGGVSPVRGMLAHAVSADAAGRRLVGPPEVQRCEEYLKGLRTAGATCLVELQHAHRPVERPAQNQGGMRSCMADSCDADMAEVAGQEMAKRALVVAATGGHNVLMVGPPGAGKSMLARRLPGILPPLDQSECLETALVHSVAGLDESAVLSGHRPFRAPHHTATRAGLIGGGSPPAPGEVSLAHNGVLFLDEMPEFGPATLQSLRQVIEDGRVILVRADGRVRFPARFALVAAANPCPCGYLGVKGKECTCVAAAVTRYQNRIGGPILDRIDLGIKIAPVDPSVLLSGRQGMDSACARESVASAREFAASRGGMLGPDASRSAILAACRMQPSVAELLESLAAQRQLSGRAISRAMKVSRTIADLDESARVERGHLMESLSYRFETGLS